MVHTDLRLFAFFSIEPQCDWQPDTLPIFLLMRVLDDQGLQALLRQKAHHKSGASSQFTAHINLGLVLIHDPFHYGQA